MSDAEGRGPLNILVCIKFVHDPNQLQADAEGHPDLTRAPFRTSTFDDNAIEAAVQLCSQYGGHAYGVSLIEGKEPPRDVFLRALAMGVDALYVIKDEAKVASDPYKVAAALAAAANQIKETEELPGWDVIVLGEASADQFNSQMGPRLAVALGIAAIPHAARLGLDGDNLIAERVTDEGAETLEVRLPALVTVGTEINQARIPTVLQVMGAQKKRLSEVPLDEIAGFDPGNLADGVSLRTLDVTAPPSSRKKVVVSGDTPEETAKNLVAVLAADGEV